MRESLSAMLGPINAEEFMAQTWRNEFMHGSKTPAYYDDLFNWDTMNRLLTQHRFVPPRLRLAQKGRQVSPGMYQKREPPFVLRSKGLTALLKKGATLIIDHIDEAHPPLRQLGGVLSTAFGAPVTINLYAGWGRDNGFNIHFDTQENFILQVEGKKHWHVWRPTRVNPTMSELMDDGEPASPKVWDSILEKGSWLYVPRGWWHVAYPVNEPSLHLTVTITPYRASDLLDWLRERVNLGTFAGSDMPNASQTNELRAYVQELLKQIEEQLSEEAIRMFFLEKKNVRNIYPELKFPALG